VIFFLAIFGGGGRDCEGRIRQTSECVYWRSGKILLYLVIFRRSVEDLRQLVKRMKQIVEYEGGGAYDVTRRITMKD
jgi:hypothetical protein